MPLHGEPVGRAGSGAGGKEPPHFLAGAVSSVFIVQASILHSYSDKILGETSLGTLECSKRPEERVTTPRKPSTFTGLGVCQHFCSAGDRSPLHQGFGEQLEALKQEWVQNLLSQPQVQEDSACPWAA